MNVSVAGRRPLVTGANSGIGQAMAGFAALALASLAQATEVAPYFETWAARP